MRNPRKIYLVAVLLLALFVPLTTASAQGPDGGTELVFTGSYRLESGETLAGGLMVFGGSAEVEDGAIVSGDVLQVGGSVEVAGEIRGSVVVFGGSMVLSDTASVHGDVVRAGGNVEISPRAEVMGQELDSLAFSEAFMIPFLLEPRSIDPGEVPVNPPQLPESLLRPESFLPPVSVGRSFDFGELSPASAWLGGLNPFESFLTHLLRAALYGILAILITLFLPRPAERVRGAVVAQPFLAGGIGIITLVLAVPVLTLLGITIILIPVSLFLLIALIAFSIFGLLAVGMEVGMRLGRAFNRDWNPALAAGLGVFILALAKAALWEIPCIGGLAGFLILGVGLGGIWLSRFGTRDYLIRGDLPVEGDGAG